MKSNESEPVSGLDVGVRREPEMQRLAQELVVSGHNNSAMTPSPSLTDFMTISLSLQIPLTHPVVREEQM